MRNNSGQSLVAVLISVAIAGIIMTVVTSMIQNMGRETQALQEKMAALDLQGLALAALADGKVCMQTTNGVTFDATSNPTATAPITVISPTTLYSSYNPGPPAAWGPVLAQTGQPASVLTKSLVVNSISLQLTDKSGTSFKGNWVINFDNTRLVRTIRPVMVSVTLVASAAAANASVTSCLGSGAGAGAGGGAGDWCGAFLVNSSGAVAASDLIMPCKGQVPACSINPSTKACFYMASTLCPSGYSLKALPVAVQNYTAPMALGSAGSAFPQGSTTSSNLNTCTAN